ncbi:D-3-phosphoglycerate dehydrogenase 2 [Batrachochytrium dendrobatidis]
MSESQSNQSTPTRLAKRSSLAYALQPFNTGDIKVLLLEGVNQTGVKILSNAGYQVETHAKALSEDILKEKIKDVHAIGIRSKTQLTASVLKEAKKLMAIGCFCIGTNQVDLEYAASHGITVFNSPFSNSRSVAEMAIAEIIALSRQLGDRNTELHNGVWNKTSLGCKEIRGKVLGIVGYGHIGSQLSVLADSLGMSIIFYDILQIMPLGTAKPVSTLKELLNTADFVTLHVPETDETRNMIGEQELNQMRKGTYLINASRGTVVDIPALKTALMSGHLAGAAVDVYPVEPFTNGKNFSSELMGCPNTLLTPHIGGSTEEAQFSIGSEVGSALARFINTGSTLGAVNFPEVDIRLSAAGSSTIRVINCHHNVPGVLKV